MGGIQRPRYFTGFALLCDAAWIRYSSGVIFSRNYA